MRLFVHANVFIVVPSCELDRAVKASLMFTRSRFIVPIASKFEVGRLDQAVNGSKRNPNTRNMLKAKQLWA